MRRGPAAAWEVKIVPIASLMPLLLNVAVLALTAEGVAEWQRLGGPPFLTPEVMHYTDGNKRCAHGALGT